MTSPDSDAAVCTDDHANGTSCPAHPGGAAEEAVPLPFPVGTALRCTRETKLGVDIVHGVVKRWHNEDGWVVLSEDNGVLAVPGQSWQFHRADYTYRPVWTYDPWVVMLDAGDDAWQRGPRVEDDEWFCLGVSGPQSFPYELGPFTRLGPV